MKTLSRTPAQTPGNKLHQALIQELPPKSVPYSVGAMHAIVEAFMATRTNGNPGSLSVEQPGVDAPDLYKEIKLDGLRVFLEIRDKVLRLTLTSQVPDVERSSSGRIDKVLVDASPVPTTETVPLTLDGKSQETVNCLLGKLKNHSRIGEIPPTLENVLCGRLLSFCQGDARKESFELPEMLWARLQPKDPKWLVQVNTVTGQIGAEVSLMKVEKYNKESTVGEDGKTKQTSEDVSYIKVGFWKWQEETKVS